MGRAYVNQVNRFVFDHDYRSRQIGPVRRRRVHVGSARDRCRRRSPPGFIRGDDGPRWPQSPAGLGAGSAGLAARTLSRTRRGRTRTSRASAAAPGDELLAVELFSCRAEAKALVQDWRQDYDEHRPHSPLGMMSPAAFARGYRQARLAVWAPTEYWSICAG